MVTDESTVPNVDESKDMESKADRQEREIEGIRDNLGHLLGELDRRRHRLAPRALIRAHPVIATALGIAVITALGEGIRWHVRRARRQQTVPGRLSRLGAALRRAIGTPDLVAKAPPSTGGRILLAVSTAAAATTARQLVRRYFARSK